MERQAEPQLTIQAESQERQAMQRQAVVEIQEPPLPLPKIVRWQSQMDGQDQVGIQVTALDRLLQRVERMLYISNGWSSAGCAPTWLLPAQQLLAHERFV
jgi:hypothetical protein